MRAQRSYFVYILASLSGTLYIGVTNDLQRRAFQHKEHEVEGFTKDYDVDRLVYWETFYDVRNAINREKQLKGWRREKRLRSSRSRTRNGRICRESGTRVGVLRLARQKRPDSLRMTAIKGWRRHGTLHRK